MDYSESSYSRGKWIWNEDKCSLEFQHVAGGITSNIVDKSPRKQRYTKISQTDTRGINPPHSAGIRPRSSTKGRDKSKSDSEGDSVITLNDIKVVALSMMEKASRQIIRSPWFDDIFQSEQLDNFLMSLLLYFHWFFEKRSLDTKHYPENVHKSRKDLADYDIICAKICQTEKLIGSSYCSLILGKGIEDNHHMMGGNSRISATYMERDMFEKLYSFCSYVIWLTFRRREYELVEKEIGRLLRSTTFNLATRSKNYVPPQKDEHGKIIKEKTLAPAEYRRLHPKRPSISDIVNQRSPILVSIMPRPKEGAAHLFNAKRDFEKFSETKSDEIYKDHHDPEKLGILGDSQALYNPETLAPEGTHGEEVSEDDPKAMEIDKTDETILAEAVIIEEDINKTVNSEFPNE